jgi:hypothetical protein
MTFIANSGTLLMLAGAFHLLIGNLLIGLGEAAILIRWFRAAGRRAVILMILANYFSMIAGMLALSAGGPFLRNAITIANLRPALITLGVGAFLLSVLLELPFAAYAIAREHRTAARVLRGAFLANTASYAVLIVLYLQVGTTSLITSTHPGSAAQLCTSPDAEVYYLGNSDGAVYRWKVSGGIPQKVDNLGTTDMADRAARLFAAPSETDGQLDLCVTGIPSHKTFTILERSFARTSDVAIAAPRDAGDWNHNTPEAERGSWFNFGSARTFDPSSPWRVSTTFWPDGGLRVHNDKSGEKWFAALETPFLSWYSRNATLLPNAQVIYQLQDQIVLLDLPTKRMGLIALGHGPLVVRRQGAEKP